MKKITFCLTLLLIAISSSFGQVQIGDGTYVDKGVPFEPSRNYSYAQSIYHSSEILASGDITYLKWYYAGFGDLSGSQEVTIYLGHTTKSSFSSSSDWVSINNLTEVYSGGITVNGAGWVNISLTSNFTYNGTDNLVIAVKETSSLSDYNEDDFYTFQVTQDRSLTWGSNSSVPNTANPANGTLRKFVPIIILEGINQDCPKPIELATSLPTTSGITLNWATTASNLQSGTQYYVSTTNIAPAFSAEPTGTAEPNSETTVVTGLLPATNYYVWVRDVCGDGPGAWSNVVAFTTLCESATELNANFNNTPAGLLPTCWTSIVTNPQFEPTATIRITNEDGYTGNSIEFARNGETYSVLTLALPPLSNIGAGTHRLKFFAKHASFNTGGTFKIGTLNSNDIDANLNEISEITTTGNFKEYIIEFTDVVDSEDIYIGIQLSTSQDFFLAYIDNIRWELAPLCPDVSQISIPTLSTTQATISWTSDESINEWEVVYGTSSSTNPDAITPVIPVLNEASVVISELTAETNYSVWVRSKCDAGTGLWVGPVSFKTPCAPVNSINENFDATTSSNLPNCWSKILRGETLSIYATVKTIWDGAHSAPKVLELYSGFSNPAPTDEIILVSPNIGNLAAGTHRLKFFAKGTASVEIGTLSSNTSTAEFFPFYTVPVTNAEMVEYVVDFDNYDQTNSFIGFRLLTTNSFTTVLIDDIVWEPIPACPDVTNITFTGTTSSSTNVAWASDVAGEWQIVYGTPSVTDPNTLTLSETLISPEVTLSDLSPNTTYKVWVRSVCEGIGNGAWSYPAFITTSCEAINTFSETFESAIAPDLPSCWTSINNDNGMNGGVSLITWQPYAGAVGVEIYNGLTTSSSAPPTLVSPSLGNLSAGTNQLRFYAYYTDTINVEIGTLDEDMTVFTPFEEVILTNSYQEYIVDFTSYEGTDSRIGFRLSSTEAFKSIGLDNITWELVPMCTNVTDVTVLETTASTADLSWTAGSDSETGWQYVYAESSITNPAALTPSTVVDVENALITDLTNGTLYNVWVRSVCSDTQFGTWVGPIVFSTKCLAINVPYTEDFETVLVPNLPLCSSIFNDVDDVNWVTVNSPGNGFNSKALSYGPNETNTASAWFFTRGINLTANQNYTISYKYGNDVAGLHESLQVKYGTSESAEGMTLTIADHNDVTGGVAQVNSVTFTPPTTGVYYFGFNAYSPANQWHLLVDDIKIDTDLSNGGFDNPAFTFYPNPVKDVLNLSYKQNISNVSVFNILGQKVYENTINSNNAQVNMSGFASGSYIVKVISENQSKVIKVIKE